MNHLFDSASWPIIIAILALVIGAILLAIFIIQPQEFSFKFKDLIEIVLKK